MTNKELSDELHKTTTFYTDEVRRRQAVVRAELYDEVQASLQVPPFTGSETMNGNEVAFWSVLFIGGSLLAGIVTGVMLCRCSIIH